MYLWFGYKSTQRVQIMAIDVWFNRLKREGVRGTYYYKCNGKVIAVAEIGRVSYCFMV